MPTSSRRNWWPMPWPCGVEGDGWPSWAFENHDAPRKLSRWCAPADAGRFARLKMALLIALRGNIILYQGEELGLMQDEIPFELLQDPEAIANWPLTLGRDGARTPMPWTSEPHGGFTSGRPWLPLSAGNIARCVAVQDGRPAIAARLDAQAARPAPDHAGPARRNARSGRSRAVAAELRTAQRRCAVAVPVQPVAAALRARRAAGCGECAAVDQRWRRAAPARIRRRDRRCLTRRPE